MDLDDKHQPCLRGSISEYKRELLGPGGCMHSINLLSIVTVFRNLLTRIPQTLHLLS